MVSSTAWGTTRLVVLPRCIRSAVWCHAVELLSTVAVSDEWSIVLALHCSHSVAAYPHAFQTLTTLPTHTPCRPMMALTSGFLETCVHWEHACLVAQTALLGFSLCLKHVTYRELWDTWQYRSPAQPGGKVQSHSTRGSVRAHLGWEVWSGVIGHMIAPEPTSTERRGPEP
jgi:hypothetical protein